MHESIPLVVLAAWLICAAVTLYFTIRENNDGPLMWFSAFFLCLMLWPVCALSLAQLRWDARR